MITVNQSTVNTAISYQCYFDRDGKRIFNLCIKSSKTWSCGLNWYRTCIYRTIISSLLVILYLTALPVVQHLRAVCIDIRPFSITVTGSGCSRPPNPFPQQADGPCAVWRCTEDSMQVSGILKWEGTNGGEGSQTSR